MDSKIKLAFDTIPTLGSLESIREDIDKILADNFDENNTLETLKLLYSCIDLTTLTATDRKSTVGELVYGVNQRYKEYKDELPPVAAICVYPSFVALVKEKLDVPGVHIAAVTGGFPASQTLLDVKVAETALTVREGADEIDIVLNVGAFLDEDYQAVVQEIEEQVDHARGAVLKVILETGALNDPELIRRASILSLYSGADFLKTSTGKEFHGASLEAAYVMLKVLKEYCQKYNKQVGFKVSGGVSSPEDAVKYYTLVKAIMGQEWLTPKLFRIGTSSRC